MKYVVELSEKQEEFLDIYLAVRPLKPEHTRDQYPSLVVNNFINSLMKDRREAFKERFRLMGLNKAKRPTVGAKGLFNRGMDGI